MFEAPPGSVQMTAEPLSTKGSRLALVHVCFRDAAFAGRPVTVDIIQIVDVDERGLLDYSVTFDGDDIDAAIAALDARYLAGEASPYANTWTAVVGTYAALNRHEIPAAPNWINVDHRRGTTVATGDIATSIRATWDVAPHISRSIEAVHRLDNFGAVDTHTACGTSRDGFAAEWRRSHF
jgi:hypothetical protein